MFSATQSAHASFTGGSSERHCVLQLACPDGSELMHRHRSVHVVSSTDACGTSQPAAHTPTRTATQQVHRITKVSDAGQCGGKFSARIGQTLHATPPSG